MGNQNTPRPPLRGIGGKYSAALAPAILAELARRDGWVHSAELVHPQRWEVADALIALVHRGYVERQRVDVPLHPSGGRGAYAYRIAAAGWAALAAS